MNLAKFRILVLWLDWLLIQAKNSGLFQREIRPRSIHSDNLRLSKRLGIGGLLLSFGHYGLTCLGPQELVTVYRIIKI